MMPLTSLSRIPQHQATIKHRDLYGGMMPEIKTAPLLHARRRS
jgi:hypothetical protein